MDEPRTPPSWMDGGGRHLGRTSKPPSCSRGFDTWPLEQGQANTLPDEAVPPKTKIWQTKLSPLACGLSV
ncbi:MAG: hypothetical protein GY820_03390 [Gammaproteobacteria bacterium]|nr:hypothetical protein [Gammaproteobacteria bacterium]